jgi:hypothetical protein
MLSLFERKSAIISECGKFRYELRRVWNESLPPYVSGMLNPSTADAEYDDPTIRRNRARAQALGFGSLIVWNLGAGRATEPSAWKGLIDPIGPDNDDHVRRILSEGRDRRGICVVGWGNHGIFMGRARAALKIAAELGVTLHCLGVTKLGQPKHPLYIADRQELVAWAV